MLRDSRLRQIPVIKSDPGLNAFSYEGIKDSAVEVQACLIGGASALGLNAGPCYGHAERFDAQLLH